MKMFSRRPRLTWTVTQYGDEVLHTADLYVENKYRIFVRLKSKIYEDSFTGDVSLDEVHWDEDLGWIIDKRYCIGHIFPSREGKLSLKDARFIAERQSRKIYKNILRNSFTK